MKAFFGLLLALVAAGVSFAAPAPSAAPAEDWRKAVREVALSHFKNPAWGYSHCLRDYALARQLAAADHVQVDDDVLYAASYLHDMAAFAPWEDVKVDHSDVGARVVDTVLKGTGFPMEKIEAVRGAIRTHMYYRDPVGPEALYLHDADALDWLGAIGVARIIALVDPHGGSPDGPKAVSMLNDNLSKVPSRVLSPAGRALVPGRKAELEKYLSDLKRESDDLRTL
ncbi:MAG TPA: HD domain-containing protein [Steroidobacteraceae bacterium]|nr:HD domain-containing protein [Steroidobacteraceae bacterium]